MAEVGDRRFVKGLRPDTRREAWQPSVADGAGLLQTQDPGPLVQCRKDDSLGEWRLLAERGGRATMMAGCQHHDSGSAKSQETTTHTTFTSPARCTFNHSGSAKRLGRTMR